jgi:DNA modification methylase
MKENTIICGDCLTIMRDMPDNSVDLVLTDPPYPDYHAELYSYKKAIPAIRYLAHFPCRQLIFWSAKEPPFHKDYTAVHIWDKKTGCGSMYERVFEYAGGSACKVYRHYLINSTVAEKFTGDEFFDHPSQKPISLIEQLIEEYSSRGDLIFDPFCGSGTTCVAAKRLGRRYIGIDISPEYCEIARKRLKAEEKGITVKELEKGQKSLFA